MPEVPDTDGEDTPAGYGYVLQAVALQTSDKQSPGVRPTTLRLVCADHGSLTATQVNDCIQAGLDADDLLVWPDRDGHRRLTLQTIPDLRRLLEHLDGELDAPEDGLEQVKAAMREVRDDE
jgi:hypothetical protein